MLGCVIPRVYFNPRSREGSDEVLNMKTGQIINFNPRSREGSDRRSHLILRYITHISIHAPAKGATIRSLIEYEWIHRFQSTLPRRERLCNVFYYWWRQFDFNPRSREGSDIISTARRETDLIFQSTLPRRERPGDLLGCVIPRVYFNPRSREGSDDHFGLDIQFTQEFQSTLPRRERLHGNITFFKFMFISIHAPAKGATFRVMRISWLFQIFQSTLPRRERHLRQDISTIY